MGFVAIVERDDVSVGVGDGGHFYANKSELNILGFAVAYTSDNETSALFFPRYCEPVSRTGRRSHLWIEICPNRSRQEPTGIPMAAVDHVGAREKLVTLLMCAQPEHFPVEIFNTSYETMAWGIFHSLYSIQQETIQEINKHVDKKFRVPLTRPSPVAPDGKDRRWR